MDDLSITPEELAQIVDQESSADGEESASSSQQLTQDDINRLLTQQQSAGSSASKSSSLAQITPEELAQITGQKTTGAPPTITPAPAPVAVPAGRTAATPSSTAHPAQFAPLQPANDDTGATNLDLLLGVTLQVTVELGRAKVTIEEILHLGPGSVVELDKLAGEPVDVLINGRLIAKGEVVVIDDRFGVRITDVIPPAQRVRSLQ